MVAESLMAAAEEWRTPEQADDMTVIVARSVVPPLRLSYTENLSNDYREKNSLRNRVRCDRWEQRHCRGLRFGWRRMGAHGHRLSLQ